MGGCVYQGIGVIFIKQLCGVQDYDYICFAVRTVYTGAIYTRGSIDRRCNRVDANDWVQLGMCAYNRAPL